MKNRFQRWQRREPRSQEKHFMTLSQGPKEDISPVLTEVQKGTRCCSDRSLRGVFHSRGQSQKESVIRARGHVPGQVMPYLISSYAFTQFYENRKARLNTRIMLTQSTLLNILCFDKRYDNINYFINYFFWSLFTVGNVSGKNI